MDITTVNDRHLYLGTITLRGSAASAGAVLAGQVIRFGPPGWLTVADGPKAAEIRLYPTGEIVSVTHLREVDRSGAQPVAL
jgi:hypothetical protein